MLTLLPFVCSHKFAVSFFILIIFAKLQITGYKRNTFQGWIHWCGKFQMAHLKQSWQYWHSCITESLWKPWFVFFVNKIKRLAILYGVSSDQAHCHYIKDRQINGRRSVDRRTHVLGNLIYQVFMMWFEVVLGLLFWKICHNRQKVQMIKKRPAMNSEYSERAVQMKVSSICLLLKTSLPS